MHASVAVHSWGIQFRIRLYHKRLVPKLSCCLRKLARKAVVFAVQEPRDARGGITLRRALFFFFLPQRESILATPQLCGQVAGLTWITKWER